MLQFNIGMQCFTGSFSLVWMQILVSRISGLHWVIFFVFREILVLGVIAVIVSLVSRRCKEDLTMRCTFLCSVMQSGQNPIHAPGIRGDGHASTSISELTASSDFASNLIASSIAC